MKGHKQIDSINDIKDFVSSYPEFKKMSGTVNKHVALLSELSKEVKENRLMEISECEQTLACGPDKDNTVSKVQEILSRKDTRLLWRILVHSLSSISQMTFKVVQVLVEYQPWDQDRLWLQRKNCTSVKNVLTQHPGDLI